GNLITKIFTDWTYLPRLSILDLQHNKIKSIHPRDLYFTASNIRVDVRYNEITEVDMDFADVLLETAENKHVAVMLDGNPIHCDCHALAFKKFSMPAYLLQHNDLRCHTPPYLHGQKFRDVTENDLTCTIKDNCPKGCNCIELPSENLIKISCYTTAHIREFGVSLRKLNEEHDPYEFEVNLSGKRLQVLNESLIRDISQQVRYVNLTGNKLTSLEFLDSVAEINNVTKFALANNPFRCDGCKFQQIWWRHYQRINDIRSVTCVPGNGGKPLSFYELVKDTYIVEVPTN
ncbi:Protein toll, partial [Orchesella cincta]